MRRSELAVLVLVESEDHLGSPDQNRPPDQIGILHHQVDRLLLRSRQSALLEDRAARADELEKAIRVDVAFEKIAGRRVAIDVDRTDVGAALVQKTSGVLTRRSGGLPVKDRFHNIADCRLKIEDWIEDC